MYMLKNACTACTNVEYLPLKINIGQRSSIIIYFVLNFRRNKVAIMYTHRVTHLMSTYIGMVRYVMGMHSPP